jgi:hypothetical protein
MSRQKFNVGQEIVSEDLNTLQSRLERGIYDQIVYELIGRKTNAFFQDSFSVLFQSAQQVVVKAGLGFQSIDTGTKEPIKKPLFRDIDYNQVVDTPDSGNPRIDIICVKHGRVNSETESRKYKDEFTNTISTQNMTIATDWRAEFSYVAGVPAANPSAPAIPAGYIKIAEILVSASTGIASQASITDTRTKLPIAVATSATGSSEYDAIVGLVGTDQGANYPDLKSALDNSKDGWKILVLRDETINNIPVCSKNGIEIVFKRGVTFTKGIAAKGIQISGNDCKVVNGRFKDFITTGDSGIHVSAGALRTVINVPRFNNCDLKVKDEGTDTFIDVQYTE